MLKDNKIWAAKSDDKELYLLPRMANRHGLIAGATGTGKTITLKVMAESFSDMGVPVFLSDVKGDLTGMCMPGADSEDMQNRIRKFGIENWQYKSYPTAFWDLFGEKGVPVRVTMSGIGPMLLSQMLNLTDVQEGVLNIVFKVADEQGLELDDYKDLRAMLKFVSDNAKEYTTLYGNISSASVGAIQRALLTFEQEGGADIFGRPALDVKDWIRTSSDGRGMINILSSDRLFQSPKTYGIFLLWMLTELYEQMPEVGDLDKPRLVFFFDEAHTLFDDTSKALQQKIAQVVKLIRSKGIGVYFITQNPADIPDDVLSQLSNKVQHGLRAYTPAEQKGVKAAANSYRANPAFKTEDVILNLGTGEALVSFLDEKGIPGIVECAKILPPQSLMGAAPAETVQQTVNTSEFDLKYRQTDDRESAYEIIMKAQAQLDASRTGTAENVQVLQTAEVTSSAAAVSESVSQTEALLAAQEAAKQAEAEKNELLAQAQLSATEKKKAELEQAKSGKSGTAKKLAEQAAKNVSSSVARSISTNIINSITGSGKVSSAADIGKRAATNALSSVMRSGATSLVRGLFGNLK